MIRRTSRRMRLCTALLICNLAFIWGNSMLPGTVSGALSDWLREVLASILPGGAINASGGGLLRKAAHFSEFACLGALLTWRLAMTGGKTFPASGKALLLALGTACVDEAIQIFSPGRNPSPIDVGIDTCGAAVGIGLLLLGSGFCNIIKQHLEETK